jgi:hypothetical protein
MASRVTGGIGHSSNILTVVSQNVIQADNLTGGPTDRAAVVVYEAPTVLLKTRNGGNPTREEICDELESQRSN